MSQQGPSSSQATASHNHETATPPLDNFVFLDEVDIGEQVRIQTRLSRTLESAYDLAVKEAIRRSLLTCSENQTLELQTDGTVGDSSETPPGQPPVSSADTDTDMNRAPSQADDSIGASSGQRSDLGMAAVDSSSEPHFNGMPDIGAIDLNDADDEDDDVPRSRRGRYHRQKQAQSERQASLDRMNEQMLERRPSLDRTYNPASERRPSLDRAAHYQSERRPSLEMRDSYLSERRPSLERFNNNRSERRPSLERQSDYRSERRPSLDRMERRPSLERRGNQQRERRPSLERVDQRERRASLDRMQSAEECLQSLSSPDASSGPAQGINTLRPWPLNELGLPTNWDVTQLPNGSALYCLVALSPMDREYSAITVDFEEAGLKVVSVERLQNTMLLERFNHEKEQLLKLRPPDFELNERYLYHGTQANKHCLCEEGLDHRLSFQGCFGRGIYFSDNPRKCMQYATSTSSNLDSNGTHPMILVCRVLLGESKKYDHGIKDSNLKREPEKPKAKGGWRYYDSVQGIPVDYPEFVVYDNRRSMIEYIVTFEEVAYRAPPAVSNFYQAPVPSLYKVEPIVLPIPEEELDRMFMLNPDTDSDGSCDEHTREVEALRDNVKRAKAKRLGIPYRPPTKEEKRYERLHWKRVCYYSCPPGSPLFEMMIMKKQQEKEERKKRKAAAKAKKAEEEGKEAAPAAEEEALGAVGGSRSTTAAGTGVTSGNSSDAARTSTNSSTAETAEPDYEVENDSVAEVLSTLIADFLNVTSMDDVAKARRYLLDNSMDLDLALCQFFRDLE